MNLTELEQTAPFGYQITRRPSFGDDGMALAGARKLRKEEPSA